MSQLTRTKHQLNCTHCIAVRGASSMIDVINPETGRTWYANQTLDEIRARAANGYATEKDYDKAEVMTIEEFCNDKASRQDTPIEWHEITEEQYHDWLEVLPPIDWKGGKFLVGEASDHHALTGAPRYQACMKKDGKHYASNRPLTRAELANV